MSEYNNFYPGMYRGSVADINDPENRGRLRLLVPQVLGDALSGWAEPTLPTASSFTHKPQDRVWVTFEGGDINRPMYQSRMEVSLRDLDADLGVQIGLIEDSFEAATNATRAFWQDEMPTVGELGYTWYDTNDNNRIRVHNGTTYVDPDTRFVNATLRAPVGAGTLVGASYTPGMVAGPAGLALYASDGLSVFLDAATGAAAFKGLIASGSVISAPVLTGGTWQTVGTANAGIKFNSLGMVAYDPVSGFPTLSFDTATGSVALTGTITAGSEIRGASFTTSVDGISGSGIRLNSDGLVAFNNSGATTLSVDAASGTVVVTGELRQATITDVRSFTMGTGSSAITILPDDGIRVGIGIHLPVDGSPAMITGDVISSSMTMSGSSAINDLVSLNGLITVKDGAGPSTPVASPAISSTSLTHSNVSVLGTGETKGLTEDSATPGAGTHWITSNWDGTTFKLLHIDKTTGGLTSSPTIVVPGVDTTFNPVLGIVRVGGFYYCLGQKAIRTTTVYTTFNPQTKTYSTHNVYSYDYSWNFAKIDPATWQLTFSAAAVSGLGPANTGGSYLGTDGTSLLVFRAANTTPVGFFVDTYTTAYVATGTVQLALPTVPAGAPALTSTTVFSGFYVGNGDYGSKRYVLSTESALPFYVWNDTGTPKTLATSETWNSPGVTVVGFHFDGTNFFSIAQNSVLYKYGTNTTNQTVFARYSWYDGDATGGTHETAASPPTLSTTWFARYSITVTTPPAPDATKTPVGTSDANRVRFYLGTTSSNPTLQNTGAVGVNTYTHSAATITAGSAYLTTTTAGWTTPPGQLASENTKTYATAGVTPSIYLSGDGSHTGITPVGMISLIGGPVSGSPTPPPGWLWCDGSTAIRTAYPRLFDIIGTYYGAGSSGALGFKLPDLSNLIAVDFTTETKYAIRAI